MVITVAYTGMRWSEVIGLVPGCVHDDHIDISWKLYELNGRFYRGRPKDGSIRPADLPPFLAGLLARQLRAGTANVPAGTPNNCGAPATTTCSSARARAISGARTTASDSSGPPLTAPTRPVADGQRCQSSWTRPPRFRASRCRRGRWPCLARSSSRQPVAVLSAWSMTPQQAGVPSAAAPGRGGLTAKSSRTWPELAAAGDRDSRPPRTCQWRRGCRRSPA